ncbi:Uncharacterised protein [Klebsiella pneumoniae]|nr:Uncharacterised protein [Klebsiella pneumoniae]
MGLKMFHFADKPLFDNLLHSQIVAIPATVMEHRQHPLFFLRQRNQFAGLLHIQGKRFIDDDMFTGI